MEHFGEHRIELYTTIQVDWTLHHNPKS